MENVFTKVYFYINLKGKEINETNEKRLKEIITEVKKYTQDQVDQRLQDSNKKEY